MTTTSVCRAFARAACLAVGLAAAGCTTQPQMAPLPPVADAAYHLGAGDKVRIITYGQSELSGTFTVDASGEISLPLLGAIKAAGLTDAQLQSGIAAVLEQRKLLQSPSVSVEIVQYRPVFVLGEVNHPGQFAYQPGMTVLSAVAEAGGFTYRAVEGDATVVRPELGEGGHALEGRLGRNGFLQPGDVVTIHERFF